MTFTAPVWIESNISKGTIVNRAPDTGTDGKVFQEVQFGIAVAFYIPAFTLVKSCRVLVGNRVGSITQLGRTIPGTAITTLDIINRYLRLHAVTHRYGVTLILVI